MSHLTGTFSRTESSNGVESTVVPYENCYGEISGDIFITMPSPLSFGAVVTIYSDSTKATKLFEILVTANSDNENDILSAAISQFAPAMTISTDS